MPALTWILVVLLLAVDADVPQVTRLRPQNPSQPEMPATKESLPVLPDLGQQPANPPPKKRAERLQPESRLSLVRYVSGEFVRAVKSIPGGKGGYTIRAGQPLDEKRLQQAVRIDGAGCNPGDTVQITKMEFKGSQIVFDINGGGKGRTRWRDRVQIQMSGAPVPQVTTTRTDPNDGPRTPGYVRKGATLILDFGRPLPDMTPDELKQFLAPVLDFSKQRSAAVLYTDSLPPEMKKAVEDKRAMVGMDREMVVAAMGKPDRRVRERDPNGTEIEDWIYGQPPGKTIFVRFAGDRVTKVQQFPK